MEGEIRQDKVTKQWVIYAPSRSKRPHELRQPARAQQAEPIYDSNCPFCAGNEQLLETPILELPHPHQPGWLTRVVRNKFPALHPAASTIRCSADMYVMMPGFGYHEVVIESPYHNQQLSGMSREELGGVIETYHRRYTALAQDPRVMLILIFRNHGARAGASLAHPHAQIIATGMVPNHCRWREDEAQRYFDQWGRCVYCDILRFEQEERRRVVFENDSFLAFVPYAAEVPFEMWIMPKTHRADFGAITDREQADFVGALHTLIQRLDTRLRDPDYNYIINSAPRYRAGDPQLHWYLEIRPRLVTHAGFEIGSGIRINPSLPEADAAFLNEVIDESGQQFNDEKRKGVRHMAKDPVCGMDIDERHAAATAEYQGQTYYFCSPGCKKAFEKEPQKYVQNTASGGQSGHH